MDEAIFIFYCISMFCTKNFYLLFFLMLEGEPKGQVSFAYYQGGAVPVCFRIM